jgi:hypothetical protein
MAYDTQHLVRQFHERFGFPRGLRLRAEDPDDEDVPALEDGIATLRRLEADLRTRARALECRTGSRRVTRLHLMTQELAEAAEALLRRSRTGLADALGDLRYVVDGTAVTYRVPLREIAEEIHASNMTKDVDPEGRRIHPVKGDDYRPPDLEGVLARADVAAVRGGEVPW